MYNIRKARHRKTTASDRVLKKVALMLAVGAYLIAS